MSGTVSIRQEPKVPLSVAIDLKEDTGRNEAMFLLEDGSYYLYESREEGTFHSLYFNPSIENELSEGILFTADDKDGIITITYKEERFIINKVGKTTYNIAQKKEDGSIQYWYGIEYDAESIDDPGSYSSDVPLTKGMSESDKHFYKWLAYKSIFIISTAFGTVTSGPYVGTATLIPTIYFELCRSGIIKVNDDLEKEFLHGTENLLSFNNVVMNSVKWTKLIESEQFVMNYKGGILSLLSLLNNAADKEFELIGREEEVVVKPELGDEWNIKLNPQVVTCQNANEQHVVQVSSKAMWKVDDSTVDHAWCNVEKVDDHIVVTVKENKISSSYQTCYESIVQGVESNTYHISPVKLFIVQNNLKFSLSEKELVFGKNGGSKPVQVEYSDNIKSWRVTQWPDWCTIDQQETWNCC